MLQSELKERRKKKQNVEIIWQELHNVPDEWHAIVKDSRIPVIVRNIEGRSYHVGINVQTLPKDKRAWVLGDHIKIDAKCAAPTFIGKSHKGNAIRMMIEDRTAFRKRIAMDVIGNASDESIGKVKDGINAITFGATLNPSPFMAMHLIFGKHAREFCRHELVKDYFGNVNEVAKSLGIGKRSSSFKKLLHDYFADEKKMRDEMIHSLQMEGFDVMLEVHDGIMVRDNGVDVERINSVLADGIDGYQFEIERVKI